MKSKLIILSIATLLGCVSCNTIGGVGKDVEAVIVKKPFYKRAQ